MQIRMPICAFLLPLAVSCGPIERAGPHLFADICPPVLLGVAATAPDRVEIRLDEPAALVEEYLSMDPDLPLASTRTVGTHVVLEVEPQRPGKRYTMEAVVRDEYGNTLTLVAAFYGYNPSVPRMVINELTVRGSTTHPDMVEIKALSDGNMGGVVLYQGTPSSFTDRLVFPPFQIQAGEFVVVHFKPQGLAEERDEIADPAVSGGLDATPLAYDFWMPDGSGISGNNGVVSLYVCPGGPLADGILYSNRTSDSDTRYAGFASRAVLERARELVDDQGWLIDGEAVRPEDAVNPEGSTATRSICRSSRSTDTNTAADWHIVPTRGASFGAENTDRVHVPAAR